MSEYGAYQDEMDRFPSVSERELDRLLAGKAPAGDGELEELDAFIRGLRAAYLAAPAPEVEERHVAAIVKAARLIPDKGDPVVRPASKAHGPGWQVSGLPKWRRTRVMLTQLFATLTAKIAAGAVAAVAATSGLAVAGALPDPAQQAVSDAAARVGITLPSPGSVADEHRKDADAGERRVDAGVREVLEDESLEGRDKGEAVADAADANRRDGEVVPTDPGAPSEVPTGNPTEFGAPSEVPWGNPTGFGQPGETPDANPTEYGAPAEIPTGNPTGFGRP